MGKLYPATSIKRISEKSLIYDDENGIEQTISILKCRDNWYDSQYGKETLISKLLKKRKKCKYVADRFWGYDEAYFVFYSDTKIKFLYQNKNLLLDDACESRRHFGYIKEQLSNTGWITFDIG